MSIERAPMYRAVCNKCGVPSSWHEMSPAELRRMLSVTANWLNVSEADICGKCREAEKSSALTTSEGK